MANHEKRMGELETEKSFEVEGIKVTIAGEELPEDVVETAKEAAKNHWELGNVGNSMLFIKKANALQETAEKGKVGLVEFLALKSDLSRTRKNDFGEYGVSKIREFTENLQDDVGQEHRVIFTVGDADLEEKPLMTNLEAYRKLRFADNELTERTLRLHLAQEQRRLGGVYFSDVEEFKVYIMKLDLQRDLPTMKALTAELQAAAEKFKGKFATEAGEKTLMSVADLFPGILSEFEKKAADHPNPDDPMGKYSADGEYSGDMALAGTVNRLADAAYDTVQRMEQEKGKGFFAALKKKVFDRGKGSVLF
jgi:hypothetical protein